MINYHSWLIAFSEMKPKEGEAKTREGRRWHPKQTSPHCK